MPHNGKSLARAREKLEQRRNANSTEHQRRLEEVYLRVPEIQRIDKALREQMAELVRLTILRPADMTRQFSDLENRNLDMQMRRAELLVENGFGSEYLDDIYTCPKCRDSGVFQGGVCSCLEKLYNQELTRELSTLLQSGDESFERFDMCLYSASPEQAGGLSPREIMEQTFNCCLKFADSFPNVSSNLLFQGGTGLGKTYLSACIARRVAEKGFSVCYDSASCAFEAFERQKFGWDAQEQAAAAERVRSMLSCDLMILDDLGTEMTTSFTVSSLYSLINTRLVNGRRTIISTNLSDDELQRRYTPQICSRIAGEFLALPFAGTDIRILKKGV